jgi:uridine phosphorylase
MIKETDLIINKDGSIYHLGLLPSQLYDHIILVGDQERVPMVAKHFSKIHYKHRNREFNSIGGELNGKAAMIISTGIGTDNIDIVLNELDALANIDFTKRTINKKKKVLKFYRIGTSGSIRESIPVDSFLASSHAVGMDVLMQFYSRNVSTTIQADELTINKLLKKQRIISSCYMATADFSLLKIVPKSFHRGITLTLPGFYAPQGREVRAVNKSPKFIDSLQNINLVHGQITNFEMETAGIYGMAEVLGHKAISFNAILANRIGGVFSKNPKKTIESLIREVLSII